MSPLVIFTTLSAGGSKRSRCGTAAPARRSARGFTLMELLMVVIIISVIAAVAMPSFLSIMRDRRVNRAAMQIAEMYRVARTRSLGRGTAVLVRWNAASGTKGRLEMREAVQNDATGLIPETTRCLSTNWSDDPPGVGETPSRVVSVFDPGQGTLFELADLSLSYPDKDSIEADFDVCFTPRGRTWFRNDPSNPSFAPLTGVPIMVVKNLRTQGAATCDSDTPASPGCRKVFIPPNGVARLEL